MCIRDRLQRLNLISESVCARTLVRAHTDSDIKLSLCNQGHKLMQERKLIAAKEAFLKSLKIKNDCTAKSQWYLSLIYLKTEEEFKRDSLLMTIIENKSHPYKTKALNLESDINSN